MIDFKALAAPFPAEEIEWRVGSTTKDKTKGLPLAYLTARAVQDRLDSVCGPENWQCRFSHAGSSSIEYSDTVKDKWDNPVVVARTLGKTVCEIGIHVSKNISISNTSSGFEEWIWKADGAGDTDFEAEKGALSDAFKRAAVKWGIGRYLYDIKAPWVSLDEFKKIAPHEMERLRALLDVPGVKVNGLSGLSKTPAKFWGEEKLIEPFTVEEVKLGGANNTDVLRSWYARIMKKIDKAPTLEHLARYQNDNQHIMDRLPPQGTEALREAFEVRAQQFDQFGD